MPNAAPQEITAIEWSRLVALINMGRHAELETTAREILGSRPNSGLLWKVLGMSLWMQGKDALEALERAARLLPADAEAQCNLGNALRARGRAEEAAASHRRAIAVDADYAEAHNNLGSALRDLGRVDEAIVSYRHAIALKPDFAIAHANLGSALGTLGRFDDAIVAYLEALKIKPEFPEAYVGLGHALQELRQPEQAAASYRRAIAGRPGLAEAHQGLGNALLDLGRLDEAEASYRRALAVNPRYAEAHNNLGMTLRQQGRHAEAEMSCRRALEIDPRLLAAVVFRGQMHADRGEFTEAERIFKQAVAIAPTSPEAWAGIAGLRKMTRDDADWLAEVQRLLERNLPPRQEIHLRYALGKCFDDLGNFDQAFAHYRRANELTRTHGVAHDRQQIARAVDQAIEFYDHGWMRRTRRAEDSSTRPVFIVGMPRSGTTLAEQILASHPAVFGAGEVSFWTVASSRFASAEELASAGGEALLLERLARDYLQHLDGLSPGSERVVDKLASNFLRLGMIHAALPNARIIHLRRNPIDTCLSIYFQDFQIAHSYACDLEDLAHYYGEYRRLMRHWRSVLPEEVMLDVAYEALTLDPEAWSRTMLDFLGLPWDPACLEPHHAVRTVTTFSKWQARQPINTTSVDRWRNYEKFIGPLRQLMEGVLA
jgi:tetratricopeptide (TPR) repeat protein